MATIKSELDYIQEARSQLAEALITKFGVRRYDNAKDNPTLKGLWTVKADGSADKLKRLHDWALLVTGTNVHTDASLTFKSDGKGDAAGTTFNGSVARSISYNSIGAAPAVTGGYLPLSGGTMTGLIKGNNKGGSWIVGRTNAAMYLSRNTTNDWHPVIGFKTKTGSWEFGSVGDNDLATFSWGSDSNYSSGTNNTTIVNLRNTSGTIALTSEIPTKASWNYDDVYSKLGHTHTTTIATSTDTNQIALAYGGKYKLTAGGTSYVFTMPTSDNTWRPIGTGATDAAAGNHTHDGRYLRWNGSAADIAAMTWGTLTSANGYTILSHAASSDGGDMGFTNKGGKIFMLLDGHYYQNEGKYRVLDTSDFTAFSNAGSLTTRITIGGVTKDLKIDADTLDGYHERDFFRIRTGVISNSNSNADSINILGGFLNATGNGSGNSNYPEGYSDFFDFPIYYHTLFSCRTNFYWRTLNSNPAGTTWRTLLDSYNYASYLDNRYYTETEADNRFVNITGDTMTGLLVTTLGSSHSGIKVGNTYINAINGELIFQNNSSIRFGGDSWDYNVWAGLKYVHSSKIIYLGLADNSAFTANSAQSGGKLYLPGIVNIYTGNGSNLVWHAGNDGSSSGLDADLLDGKHASDFAINDHNHINYLSANGSVSGNIDNIWIHGTYGFGNRSNYTGTLPGNSSYGGFLVLNPYATTGTYYTTQVALLPGYFGYRIYDDGKWYDWKEVSMVGHTHDGRYLRYEGGWKSGSGQNVDDSHGMTFTYTNHGSPHHWGTTVTFESSRNSSYRLQLHGTGDNYLFFRNRSSDYGGWHSSGWKQILTNLDTYVSGNKGYINSTEITYVNNADKLDGCHATMGSSKPWGTIPAIGTDGVIELGRYIDFHYDNITGSDYSTRLQVSGNHSNVVNLPSASGTLALTSQIPNVTNYYWANIKVSSNSNTSTNPEFSRIICNYKSGTWVNSLTASAISLPDASGSYGGWICGPTRSGRIAISTYQASDNYLYFGYGERGRTTNSFATNMYWDGPSNCLYAAHFYEISDIRLKDIKSRVTISAKDLSKLPLFNFTWNNQTNDTLYSGTSAQDVLKILPTVVSYTEEHYQLDYATLGTIAGITACKELVNLKSEIDLLKERIKKLELQLKMINDYGRC